MTCTEEYREHIEYTFHAFCKVVIRNYEMTNSKIDRIEKEMQKTREKISEYQNRLKELAAQKTEAENLQIIALVRSMRLTPAELTALLSGEPIPGIAAAGTDYMEQEETEDEE